MGCWLPRIIIGVSGARHLVRIDQLKQKSVDWRVAGRVEGERSELKGNLFNVLQVTLSISVKTIKIGKSILRER